MMLGIKDAPKTDRRPGWTPGCTALTPTEWREHLARFTVGEFVVIGGVEDNEFPSLAYTRATAQWIFDELVADNVATDGYRVRIVAVER